MTDDAERKAQSAGSAAAGWWHSWRPQPRENGRKAGDAGAMARLRRADLFEAATEQATVDLFHRLETLPQAPRSRVRLFERAALVAAVLAHVRRDNVRRIATAAGEKSGDQRRLHPLRLRRLLAVSNPADCLVAFRRLVAVLDDDVNVADLADNVFDWPDEMRGDARRTRFAFDYYGAGDAAPADDGQAA